MVKNICHDNVVELTAQEFRMIQECKFSNYLKLSCEDCDHKFVCYTSRIIPREWMYKYIRGND